MGARAGFDFETIEYPFGAEHYLKTGETMPDSVLGEYRQLDAILLGAIGDPRVDTGLLVFGDIITDLGAMIQGGLGIAASANIHPGQVSMFEPIHGSAPKYKGKGVACPVATVAAVGMMLEFLGNTEGAARIDKAIGTALSERRIPSLSTASGLRTSQYTDVLLDLL